MASGSVAIGKKKEVERNLIFPDAPTKVWSRKTSKGFTTLPRAMPLLGLIMDRLTKGSPVSAVYTDLWYKSFDEMYLNIESPQERAYYSGFGGQRAETTWTTRMRLLAGLGFIEVKSGTRGEFHHVLIVNPYLAVRAIEADKTQSRIVGPDLWEAYHLRLREVGAEEIPISAALPPPAAPASEPPRPRTRLVLRRSAPEVKL